MDLKEISTEKLLQWYSNAKKTSSCGGHYKGQQNEQLYKSYSEELSTRNIIVPKSLYESITKSVIPNVTLPEGVFNGDGSF
jgi:hypothetical protein